MTHDPTLASFRLERRELPDNISKIHIDGEPREDCWHCHNSVQQTHMLRCSACGNEQRVAPAIQHEPSCRECGELWECVRATWRLEDRGMVYYDPKTGDEIAVRKKEQSGERQHYDLQTGEPVDYPDVLEERGLA